MNKKDAEHNMNLAVYLARHLDSSNRIAEKVKYTHPTYLAFHLLRFEKWLRSTYTRLDNEGKLPALVKREQTLIKGLTKLCSDFDLEFKLQTDCRGNSIEITAPGFNSFRV